MAISGAPEDKVGFCSPLERKPGMRPRRIWPGIYGLPVAAARVTVPFSTIAPGGEAPLFAFCLEKVYSRPAISMPCFPNVAAPPD